MVWLPTKLAGVPGGRAVAVRRRRKLTALERELTGKSTGREMGGTCRPATSSPARDRPAEPLGARAPPLGSRSASPHGRCGALRRGPSRSRSRAPCAARRRVQFRAAEAAGTGLVPLEHMNALPGNTCVVSCSSIRHDPRPLEQASVKRPCADTATTSMLHAAPASACASDSRQTDMALPAAQRLRCDPHPDRLNERAGLGWPPAPRLVDVRRLFDVQPRLDDARRLIRSPCIARRAGANAPPRLAHTRSSGVSPAIPSCTSSPRRRLRAPSTD